MRLILPHLLRHGNEAVAGLGRSFAIGGALARLLVATGLDLTKRRDGARGRFAVRLRATLESLGPTFVKLGQFLAIRFDLLPVEVCRSLEALFENVGRLSFEEVRGVIEEELHAPLAESFPRFEEVPVAAASLAQVHVARTADGAKVAVKVQRPGVAHAVRTDLRILRGLGRLADALGVLGAVSAREMMDQFAYYAERELDFVEEGRTADALRRGAVRGEIIPVVYWKLTTTRVLTLEFVDGVSLAEVGERLRAGDDQGIRHRLPSLRPARVLHNLVSSALHQLFVAGYFHGDPHPGNVIVCADNRVALVDFGIAGCLTGRDRLLLRRFLGFLALGNFEESYRHYAQLFQATEDTDLASFRRQTIALMRQWRRLASDPSAVPELRVAGRFSDRMSTLVRAHRLRMSMDTLLFWRVLVTLDSTALRFAARLDLLHELRTFFLETQVEDFRHAFTAHPGPEPALAGLGETLASAADVGRVLRPVASPRRVRALATLSPSSEDAASRRFARLLGAILAVSALASTASLVPSMRVGAMLAMGAAALLVARWRMGARRRLRRGQ